MKKGFTLIEILAVVTIIGLIFVIALPKIINSLNSKKSDIDNTTNNMIISAAKMYVNDHNTKFDKIEGSVYCLPLTTLTKEEYLDSKVKNVTDDKDITNIKSVKISYDNTFHYEIVNNKDCSVINKNYTELNYLESTGTQYIDTDYKPTKSTKVEAILKFEGTFNYNLVKPLTEAFFGANDSKYVFSINFAGDPRRNTLFAWSDIKYSSGGKVYSFNITDEIKNNFNKLVFQSKILEYENIKYDIAETTSDISKSLIIFGRNYDGDIRTFASYNMDLKSFKIYDNNDLVRDFIPVLDNNGIACLFDKVENKYYYNQGTGEFLYG